MALHDNLPIYRSGVRLLDLAVKAQVQMPRTVKRALGEKITQHCVEMLDLMALANATQRDVRAGYIEQLLTRQRAVTVLLRQATHSHHDRTRIANLLLQRGRVVKGDFTKTYRRTKP